MRGVAWCFAFLLGCTSPESSGLGEPVRDRNSTGDGDDAAIAVTDAGRDTSTRPLDDGRDGGPDTRPPPPVDTGPADTGVVDSEVIDTALPDGAPIFDSESDI